MVFFMENYTIHRCPKCDTINKGNVCVVCGELLSDDIQVEDVQPTLSNSSSKKSKILYFTSLCFAILVTAIVTSLIIESRTRDRKSVV